MDTKDKDSELASPGVMFPDSSMSPLIFEEGVAVNGAEAPGQVQVLPPGQQSQKSPTPLQDSLRRLRRDKRAMLSLGIIVLFVLIPLFGPIIYQHIGGTYISPINGAIGPSKYHNPFWTELTNQDQLPSSMYWLGTDGIGWRAGRLFWRLDRPVAGALHRSHVRLPRPALRHSAHGYLWHQRR